MKIQMSLLSLSFLAFATVPAFADYIVNGPVEGTFCSGFIVEACGNKRIDAVFKGEAPYSLPNSYDSVDEYSSSKNLCWIRINSGAVNWLLGDIPVFYQYQQGPRHLKSSYLELGTPDYLTFKCVRR